MRAPAPCRNGKGAVTRYLPLDRLCLSPHRGFAGRDAGNPITVDDRTARLALVVQVATDVRGGVLPSRG